MKLKVTKTVNLTIPVDTLLARADVYDKTARTAEKTVTLNGYGLYAEWTNSLNKTTKRSVPRREIVSEAVHFLAEHGLTLPKKFTIELRAGRKEFEFVLLLQFQENVEADSVERNPTLLRLREPVPTEA